MRSRADPGIVGQDQPPTVYTAEVTDVTGSYRSTPHSGQIAFTDSTVAVQATNPDTIAPDTAYTVRGYESFYGDLTADDQAGTFLVRVTSRRRDLIGQTLTRRYRVSGNTLVLTPIDATEGWRVTDARHIT